MDLSNFFEGEMLNDLKNGLTPEQQVQLAKSIDIIDNYTDATSYDEVLGSWMDSQGYYDSVKELYDSYVDLSAKLKEANLMSIPPFKEVSTILGLLASLVGNSLEEGYHANHDSEPRPSRMERPDISAIPPYGRCWPGFYIGDQLANILTDKYGTEKGEKMFQGLLDTGNNAIYKVCGDIMREKYAMLKAMGEDPSKHDYDDLSYFNLWKTWVANKGRKATKAGKIIPLDIKEHAEGNLTELANQILELCKAKGIDSEMMRAIAFDDRVEFEMSLNQRNIHQGINARQAVRNLIKSKNLQASWSTTDFADDSSSVKVKCIIKNNSGQRPEQESEPKSS